MYGYSVLAVMFFHHSDSQVCPQFLSNLAETDTITMSCDSTRNISMDRYMTNEQTDRTRTHEQLDKTVTSEHTDSILRPEQLDRTVASDYTDTTVTHEQLGRTVTSDHMHMTFRPGQNRD